MVDSKDGSAGREEIPPPASTTKLIRPIWGEFASQGIELPIADADQAIADGWAFDPFSGEPREQPPILSDEERLHMEELSATALAKERERTGGGVPGGGGEGGTAPTLTALNPNTAEVGAADVVMTATGTGFDTSSVIVWNEGDEPTVFVSATALTTIVKPSTAVGAAAVPVKVRTGGLESEPLTFTFTDAAGRRARASRDR